MFCGAGVVWAELNAREHGMLLWSNDEFIVYYLFLFPS